VKLEEMIGARIRQARELRGWSQQQLGDELEPYLGRVWTRQAVSSAEKGGRDFTAAELIAFASVFRADVATLFLPDAPEVELPGCTLTAAELLERASGAHLAGNARRASQRLEELHRLAREGLSAAQSALESADVYVEWLAMDRGEASGESEPNEEGQS
jgi:transcriptional regulator with XRE-family HTH domain